MRKLLVTSTLLMLTVGPAAIAQNSGSSSSKQGPWPAPTGHRQPRADQVPEGKNNPNATDAEKRQDAELDRKIKSICRGC
jgi:hypothetical protein